MAFAERMGNWVQRDLGHGSVTSSNAGWLREMGSFSSNLGFYSAELGGASRHTAVFANRAVGNSGVRGWVGHSKTGGTQVFSSMTKAMDHSGIGNNTVNRGLFRMGLRGRSGLAMFNLAFTGAEALSSYSRARQEGKGFVSSVGAGAMGAGRVLVGQKLLSMALRNPYTAVAAATVGGTVMLAKTAVNSAQMGNRYREQAHLSELTGNASRSMHTRPAATMRQRSLMSINNSQFNAMRSLGNEASFTHMPKSRYGNSTYSASPRPILGY